MTAAAQHGVVTATQCREAGLTEGRLKTLCRDRRWLRLNEGVYLVDADLLTGDPPRRSLIRAALFSAGPHAVAVLGTAAEVLNLGGLHRDPTIHISLPGERARPERSTEAGVRLHQLVLRPDDTTVMDGFPLTTPARTVADLILRTDRMTAVCLLDSSLNRRILIDEELDLVRALIRGRRGAVRARPWINEADARAESPLETRVRLRAVDGGIGPDELQYRVRSAAGDIVAIGDFAWLRARARVVGEADGAEAHDSPVAVFRDRKRQNDIIAAGLVPVRFAWPDTNDPGYVPHVIPLRNCRRRVAHTLLLPLSIMNRRS
jgi:hypothetical protein